MMTPVAQQSTGLPYLCLPTTSGAAKSATTWLSPQQQAAAPLQKPAGCSLTQVLGRPTGVLDEPVLQFSKMEVADDYFGVLETVVINQVLQLKEHMGVVTVGAFLLQGFHFQS